MKILKVISDVAEKICILLCIILTVIITFSAFMQVFSRFALGGAWKWTDEACRYCLVWLAMLGAALGVKRKAHLAIDVILNAMPTMLQKVIGCISLLAVTIFGCILVQAGLTLSKTVMQQKSAVMGLPMGIVYLAVPIFGVFLSLFSLVQFCESVFDFNNLSGKGES